MTEAINKVKLVRAPDGSLLKPQLGEFIDGYEVGGILFDTFILAEAHQKHLPLRARLEAAMFEIVVNTGWFHNDDDENIQDMAERLATAMLGVNQHVIESRDEIIAVLLQDKELYS